MKYCRDIRQHQIRFSKWIWFVVVLCCSPGCLGAQELVVQPASRVEKLFRKGVSALNQLDYPLAKHFFHKAIQRDVGFVDAYLMLAEIYQEQDSASQAIRIYHQALQIDSLVYPPFYLFLANLELSNGDYYHAGRHYRRFLQFEEGSAHWRAQARKKLKRAEFGSYHQAHPVPFLPHNLGKGVNSVHREFVNSISTQGHLILFTRRFNNRNGEPKTISGEDIYLAHREKGVWQEAVPFGTPLNTHQNEGALMISPDGRYIFFAACGRSGGYGSCDLYYSVKRGEQWGQPVNLGSVVNSAQWDSQPCLAADGRTLYFASKRPGGFGSSDIWRTHLRRDGSWSVPENLGPHINTAEAEMAPFLHPDGQTLFFSSEGHAGMGKADLFVARKEGLNSWTQPENLGYPINTCADEKNILVNPAGDTAYLSSDALGGEGSYDIYQFSLHEQVRPQPVSFVTGKVYDAQSRAPIQGRFELIDLSGGQTVVESWADPVDGRFLVCLPVHHEYALNVSHPDYLFYSAHFSLKQEAPPAAPFALDVPMQALQTGAVVVLNNIFFETNRAELLPQSAVELKRVLELLNVHPEMKIEIRGHTDNRGESFYNQQLSEKRAEAVYQYLLNKGVQQTRLSFVGLGEKDPVATNQTSAGRAQNRRTEFRIL